jgi:hypothetical protein
MNDIEEYIVCFIEKTNSVDFTEPLTKKEYKSYIKKHSKDWSKYYITKIVSKHYE